MPAQDAAEVCRRRSTCRLCGSGDLELVFALVPTPPANAFVPAERKHEVQARFPLDVFFCRACTHVQLLDVVDPSILFENYVYVSGTSPVFVRHFQEYAEAMLRRLGSARDKLIVDIGSNDGTLLRFFATAGWRVLGIDPAREIAGAATALGIETLPEFLTPALANRIVLERGQASIVTANNVFAHVDDLGAVVDCVRAMLEPDGLFAFEVSYLVDVVEKALFDTIYHEHLDYHAVRPLVGFLARHGMQLIAAERVPSHGGSLRGIAQVASGRRPVEASVAAALALEAGMRLEQAETYREFSRRVDAVGRELKTLLTRLKSEGKRIAGFGAPAKATTLMYQFGIGPELVDFVVDDSPLKQGLFTPGMHIPVVSSAALAEHKPDYVVVLAWNFASPIIAKNDAFRKAGGRFIVPLPTVEVH